MGFQGCHTPKARPLEEGPRIWDPGQEAGETANPGLEASTALITNLNPRLTLLSLQKSNSEPFFGSTTAQFPRTGDL